MSSDLEQQLIKYLNDAHTLEMQSMEMLEKAIELAGDLQLAQLYRGRGRRTGAPVRAASRARSRPGPNPDNFPVTST